MPITPLGSNASPEVLIARNSTMASVAVPFSPLRRSSSVIALIPNGVAALPSPRKLLDRFRRMAWSAGWSLGTEGNRRRSTGQRARDSIRSSPPSSATFISPRNSAMTPTRPMARSTAPLAESSSAFVTASMPPP